MTTPALHLVGLPHTSTISDWSACAYTQKIRRFATMMTEQGWDVYLYGGPDNEAKVADHIPLVSHEDQDRWWPDWDRNNEVWNGFDVNALWWRVFNSRAIAEIRERIEPHDLIGLIGGRCQQPVADAFPHHLSMEWGVGYEGIFTRYRCFESYAWMHHVYGLAGVKDGQFFDTVIPNSYEPDEFYPDECREREDLLFIGRMIERKGLPVVQEIAKRHRVVTAGQGVMRIQGAEHLGTVKGQRRLELFQHARAVLVPTTYIEPFGGVAVEAMLCGTPVITTDWGAFPELVEHGVTGFRCRTLREFLAAVESIEDLDREEIAWAAEQRWTTAITAPLYDQWLQRLLTLYDDGWYAGTQETDTCLAL
jgi:glycosyltransferase involved in cell wall biosynthesis